MNEPETHDSPAEQWSPPTGAPAPRPDPYAQFGNPLHDTWGTADHQPSVAPKVSRPHKARKVRPGLKWVITACIVGVLAVVGWLARDTLVDAWDTIYDKASDITGDEGKGDATEDDGGNAADATQGTDERLAELEAANNEAFDAWMDANRGELSAAIDRMDAASADLVALQQALGSDAIKDLGAYRDAVVESRDATVAAAQVLDAAPESEVRNDFVTTLLLRAGETGEMITAIETQDEAGLRAASGRVERIDAETRRLCNQHGNAAKVICG